MNLDCGKKERIDNCQFTSDSDISTSSLSSAVSTKHLENLNEEKIEVSSKETYPFVLQQDSNCRQNDKRKSRYFPHFGNKSTEREGKVEKHCFFNKKRNCHDFGSTSLKTSDPKAPCCGMKKRKYLTQDESQQWNDRNVDKNINEDEDDSDDTAKRLKLCDNYENSVLTTTNDKICCLKQHPKGGVETFNEKYSDIAQFKNNTQENMSYSKIQKTCCSECHPNFDNLFKNDNRVSILIAEITLNILRYFHTIPRKIKYFISFLKYRQYV